MITRCFSPPLSVSNGAILERQRARRRERLARDREVVRPLDLERAAGAGSVPSARPRATRVVEREVRLLRHDRHAPGERWRGDAADVARRRACTRPRDGASNPASTRSSVVLPEPFGPRMPTKPPAGTRIDTPSSTGADAS